MPENIARELHIEATSIVHKLSPIFQKYGQLTQGGSFNLDLMAWPDIDLYLDVGTNDPLKAAFAIGQEAILLPEFFATKIEREMTKRLYFVPDGTYLQLQKRRVQEPHWKMDIWILDTQKIEELKAQADEFKKHLNAEKRQLILHMKQSLMTDKGRTPRQSGFYLLQAIALQEMTNKEEILHFLKQHGVK